MAILHFQVPILTGMITMYVQGIEMNTAQMGEIDWIGSAPNRQWNAFRH
jgi:hypothetical protein